MHMPVLYEESLNALQLANGKTIVDGTLGGCGHAKSILKGILPDGKLIGIDKDPTAIKRAEEVFKTHQQNVELVQGDFKDIHQHLEMLGIDGIDGALLDLGVSSYQLEQAERGFSYMQDAPLNMRMDITGERNAAYVVNRYTQEELARVIQEYGEERWAKRIAEFIATARVQEEIATTGQLVDIIKKAVPKSARKDGPHPAKRTFQAIRIEVNGELAGLANALEDYVQALRSGGRLAVITFHSLEDRIVKQVFKKMYDPCECPKDVPCFCGKVGTIKLVTRKPITPGGVELEENPRARSAKLRVIEKL